MTIPPFTADPTRLLAPSAYTMKTTFAMPRSCPTCSAPMTAINYSDVTINGTETWTLDDATSREMTMVAKAAHALPCGCRLYAVDFSAVGPGDGLHFNASPEGFPAPPASA